MKRIALFLTFSVFIICGVSCNKPKIDGFGENCDAAYILLKYPQIKEAKHHEIIRTESGNLSAIIDTCVFYQAPVSDYVCFELRPSLNYIVCYENEYRDTITDIYIDWDSDVDYKINDIQFKFNGEIKHRKDIPIYIYPKGYTNDSVAASDN